MGDQRSGDFNWLKITTPRRFFAFACQSGGGKKSGIRLPRRVAVIGGNRQLNYAVCIILVGPLT